jgi:uncharacterized protein YegP (UPF0339 family)
MEYTIYQDAKREWRWHFTTNGRVIADSGEGYVNRQDAERGIQIMKNSADALVKGVGGLLGDGIVRR